MMPIFFNEAQYPKSVIVFAPFFYVCSLVSSRDLERIMAERGVVVDYAGSYWQVAMSTALRTFRSFRIG